MAKSKCLHAVRVRETQKARGQSTSATSLSFPPRPSTLDTHPLTFFDTPVLLSRHSPVSITHCIGLLAPPLSHHHPLQHIHKSKNIKKSVRLRADSQRNGAFLQHTTKVCLSTVPFVPLSANTNTTWFWTALILQLYSFLQERTRLSRQVTITHGNRNNWTSLKKVKGEV
jgi:hypothetical protein